MAYGFYANLVISKGAVFHIDSTDTKWLKLKRLRIKPSQLNLGNVDHNKPLTLVVDALGLTVSNKVHYIG